jgi:hypothetical protein
MIIHTYTLSHTHSHLAENRKEETQSGVYTLFFVWWVLGSFHHLLQQSLKEDIRTKAIVIHSMTILFKGLLILLGFP